MSALASPPPVTHSVQPHPQHLQTRSPRASAEHLAFLPHPHPPTLDSPTASTSALSSNPVEGSSSTSMHQRPHRSPRGSYTRPRSGTSSSSGSGSRSPRVRSAPTSPSGRSYPAGLAPLSVMSPIKLGASLPSEGSSDGIVRGVGVIEARHGVVSGNQAQDGGLHQRAGPSKSLRRYESDSMGQSAEMSSRAISDTAVQVGSRLPQDQMAQLQYEQRAALAARIQGGSGNKQDQNGPSTNVPLPFAPPNQLVQYPQQLSAEQLQHIQAQQATRQGAGMYPGGVLPQRIVSQPLRASIPTVAQQQAYYQQQQHLQQRQLQAQHARAGVPFPVAISPQTANITTLPTSAAIASMELSGHKPKPRLLRSRSRSRQKTPSASGTSGSETETGMDSDTTMTPHRLKKNSGSLSQPNLTSLRSRLEGWAGDVAMQSQGAGLGGIHPSTGGTDQTAKALLNGSAHGLGLLVGQQPPEVTIPPSVAMPRRASYEKGRTPPSHAVSLPSSPGSEGLTDLPRRSPSRSITHLSSLRLSPVTSTTNFAAHHSANRLPRRSSGPDVTFPAVRRPSTDTRGSDDSLRSFNSSGSLGSTRPVPVGAGAASSEDADDSLDSASTGDASSPSSGSLSFEPRRRNTRWRQGQGHVREKERLSSFGSTGKSSLGLSFDEIRPNFAPRVVSLGPISDSVDGRPSTGKELRKALPRRRRFAPLTAAWTRVTAFISMILGIGTSNMWSLRMLAVFPAVWGWLVLMQAVFTGGLWVDVYPWGIDTSREALDRLIMGGKAEGRWEMVERGDMLLSSLWAILTGHYCFEMTTGLTRRWRVYYDLPATITRLLSIQCICWPLTGLTLWILGHERTLFAWVVIGVTTAASRSVQMYVTSNIPSSVIAKKSDPKRQNSGDTGSGGDETDTPKRSRANLAAETVTRGNDKRGGWWEDFKKDREWRWDAVAEEVGWKAGALLLLTCAWLFWGIEMGRWKV